MVILEGMGINILSKVLEMLTKTTWQQAQKQYEVAKFLEKHDFLALKEDFASIYLHALIHYQKTAPLNGWIRLLGEKQTIEKYKENFYDNELTEENLIVFLQQEIQTNSSQKHNDVIELFYAQPNEEKIRKQLQLFKKEFDERQMYAMNPGMLTLFNKMQEGFAKREEAAYKKSFPYQAEVYLKRKIADFEAEYLTLESGLDKYIPVNGETRIYRENASPHFFKKNSLATKHPSLQEGEDAHERERYKATPFKPINNFLNNWLQDDMQNLLIVVGEYGTGKTTLMKYLTYHLGQQRIGEGAATAPIQDIQGRLPVFMPLNKFETELPTFVGKVCEEVGIEDINFSRFKELARDGKLLIILDGFDEMTQYINPTKQRSNFGQVRRQLLEGMPNSKVILTTRSEYFKSMAARERIFETARHNNFGYVYVQPFENEQVRQYLLAHGYGNDYWDRVKRVLGEDNDVISRPVLLEIMVKYLPELLAQCDRDKRALLATDLYKLFIEKELERKVDDLVRRNWLIEGKDRMQILEAVALWMFQNDTLYFNADEIGEELDFKSYFKTNNNAQYENYLHEFLTFSFLKPQDVAAGTFQISHKSFMEYLVAKAFVEALDTEKAAEVWGKGKNPLTEEIQQLIRELAPQEDKLLQLILQAKDLPDDRVWQGTNAANVLLWLNKNVLVGQDLTGCQLTGVGFLYANLKGTVFKNTNLSNCYFRDSISKATLVEDCDFSGNTIYLIGKDISQLSILPLQSLSQLSTLWIDGTSIANFSLLSYLTGLKNLIIIGNSIIDLNSFPPLTNLNSLEILSTQIIDLNPLQSFTQLNNLWLCNNKLITNLSPLHSLSTLKILQIDKNQFPDTQIQALQAALPDLKIIFE